MWRRRGRRRRMEGVWKELVSGRLAYKERRSTKQRY
jgi:hypothetical protein